VACRNGNFLFGGRSRDVRLLFSDYRGDFEEQGSDNIGAITPHGLKGKPGEKYGIYG
jgi:hypothetical protein